MPNPVYLLWGEDLQKNHPILKELEQLASCIVFDSEASVDIQKFSWQVLQEMSTTERLIFDLNWAALRGWREVLSQLFRTEAEIRELYGRLIEGMKACLYGITHE